MNGTIDIAILYQVTVVPMASHDQKCHCTSIQLSWPGKCNVSIDDAISIM